MAMSCHYESEQVRSVRRWLSCSRCMLTLDVFLECAKSDQIVAALGVISRAQSSGNYICI